MIKRMLRRLRILFVCPECDADYVGSNPSCQMCEEFRNDRLT